jgi:secernin
MCDSLCVIDATGLEKRSVFAKNSDRPVDEIQLLRSYPARSGGGNLETQYLEIPDLGAIPTVLSQPTWLWGAEHGVNAKHVAIGNERVYGVDDPTEAEPGLIGMDLVRLGLERARTADEAVDVITDLLEHHGQGGVADRTHMEPYWSSFLVVDPLSGWVVETTGRTWAARPVDSRAAISNRITITTDWTRASGDVAVGTDFDRWRDPTAPTGHADNRLGASDAFLGTVSSVHGLPRRTAAHLRDHGKGPWGAPGGNRTVDEPPSRVSADGTGVTVCMHVRGYMTTTASMIAELDPDPDVPVRVWAAIGSPCASVYLPFDVPTATNEEPAVIPGILEDDADARRFAELRGLVESSPGALERVRVIFGTLEEGLWAKADLLVGQRQDAWRRFAEEVSLRTSAALGDALATTADAAPGCGPGALPA